jgi:hypothetical protein
MNEAPKIWFCQLHNCGGTGRGCTLCASEIVSKGLTEYLTDTGCPACKAEGCNCYVTELPIVTNP